MQSKATYSRPVFFILIFYFISGGLRSQGGPLIDSVSVHKVSQFITQHDLKFFQQFIPKGFLGNIEKALGPKTTLKKNTRIFGWYPDWMGDAYKSIDYSLMTHVSYFGCGIDPSSGSLSGMSGWDTTGLVAYCKKQNPACKVLINFFGSGTSAAGFLSNAKARQEIVSQLLTAILKKNGDGICVDFEELPASASAAFSTFISELNTAFKQKGLLVSITLPALGNSAIDLQALKPYVDLYILMGYGYFGESSKVTGPVAPLHNNGSWIYASVESSVDLYLKSQVPDSLLLLGVPYYGAIWETKNASVPAPVNRFIGYRPYSYAVSLSLSLFNNDTAKQAMYYCYPTKQDSQALRQFWIDGVQSLGAKYDLVLQKNLGGIAIWALGFDAGSSDLQNLLLSKFSNGPATADTSAKAIIPLGSYEAIFKFIEAHPLTSCMMLYAIFVVVLVVLIKAATNPAYSAKLKSSGLLYVFIPVIVFILYLNSFVILHVCFKLSLLMSVILLVIFTILAFVAHRLLLARKKVLP